MGGGGLCLSGQSALGKWRASFHSAPPTYSAFRLPFRPCRTGSMIRIRHISMLHRTNGICETGLVGRDLEYWRVPLALDPPYLLGQLI